MKNKITTIFFYGFRELSVIGFDEFRSGLCGLER